VLRIWTFFKFLPAPIDGICLFFSSLPLSCATLWGSPQASKFMRRAFPKSFWGHVTRQADLIVPNVLRWFCPMQLVGVIWHVSKIITLVVAFNKAGPFEEQHKLQDCQIMRLGFIRIRHCQVDWGFPPETGGNLFSDGSSSRWSQVRLAMIQSSLDLWFGGPRHRGSQWKV